MLLGSHELLAYDARVHHGRNRPAEHSLSRSCLFQPHLIVWVVWLDNV